MVSPTSVVSGPLQPDTLANQAPSTCGKYFLSYGFQLVALLLGLALAFL